MQIIRVSNLQKTYDMAQPPTQPRFSTPSPPLPPQMHAGWPGSAGIRQVPVFFVPNTVMPYPIYPGNPPPAGAPMFLGTPAGPHSSARTYAVSLTPRGSPSVSSLPLAAASPSVTGMMALKVVLILKCNGRLRKIDRKIM